MLEFALAALPWVGFGIALAVVLVYFDRKSEKEK